MTWKLHDLVNKHLSKLEQPTFAQSKEYYDRLTTQQVCTDCAQKAMLEIDQLSATARNN
jgi:hypothetical protein